MNIYKLFKFPVLGVILCLRFRDGTSAAFQLNNYLNGSSAKGFLTMDYIYHLDL